MRLKCIKLVGFKSFVDATTVHFPSNMCGVVGPNGCGKSNIIDAVRWVMGESSAKNLRGESMLDVIFKGSKARKAAGYAQVELVFDNNEGRITGEYAAYTEISVKRRLSSDAQNTYFLNGTKCRRRDIMDIFMGTGLGPRSYSIISQGMVSNLIESKPEELRVFIEEAAGISKYKERRRETENRIRRTTENLERLTDLREELDRRLSHLKRQAESAEKYKKYKEEERHKRAQLHGIRWRATHEKLESHESTIRDYEIKLEEAVTKQVSGDTEMEKLRLESQESNDKFQEVQSRYYKVGNDITRLEQTVAHQQEKQEQLSIDLRESEGLKEEGVAQIASDKEGLAEIEVEINALLPELEIIEIEEEEHQERLLQAEESMMAWQKKWDTFNEQASTARRNAEVAQSGIQHIEQVLTRLHEQVLRDQEELEQLQSSDDNEAVDILNASLLEQEERCESLTEQAEVQSEKTQQYREQIESLMQRRQLCHRQLSEAQGKKASLTALQSAALNQGEESQKWLQSQKLDKSERLAEKIRVSEGWDVAVETVLGDFLQSVSVGSVHDIANTFTLKDKISLNFIDSSVQKATLHGETHGSRKALSEYVSGEHLSILHGVFVAKNLAEALSMQVHLNAGESVITPEGVWLGVGWLRVARDKDVSSGVLARQDELETIDKTIEHLSDEVDSLQNALDEARSELLECEQAQKEAVQMRAESSQRLGELKAELHAQQSRIEQDVVRRRRLEESLASLREQECVEQVSLGEHRIALQGALDSMEKDNDQQEGLRDEQGTLRQSLEMCKQALHSAREKSHVMALNKQTLEAQRHARIQAIERLQAQQERLEGRVAALRSSLSDSSDEARVSLREELEVLLEQRVHEEGLMQKARSVLDSVKEKLMGLEKERSKVENEAQNIRTHLENLRMDGQAMRIRCTTLQEQLSDEHFDLPTVVNNLPEDANEQAWEQALAKLESRISQLGAINLAAIDEYDQQSERLRYLNQQNDDLEEALNTLKQAIERIDKETRQRFETTFNKVNEGLMELFPRVFGGGQAYLEQTGDDLLSTGVTIMAQPPGKKNSTIHLLSGGEKALTAIALVFAIFRLNPSPFCLLDEVDAPLDDANVGRYTRMVKEMSVQVQFIYVTHNKIAMEAANQLIGVTMHEPGVSRPVSVDIDAAAEMAL